MGELCAQRAEKMRRGDEGIPSACALVNVGRDECRDIARELLRKVSFRVCLLACQRVTTLAVTVKAATAFVGENLAGLLPGSFVTEGGDFL